MKKIYLTLVSVLVSLAAVAQASSGHLSFKGLPIDGHYKTFAQQLIQKGFSPAMEDNAGIFLRGTFMGEPGVTVLVRPNHSTLSAVSVIAMIDAGDSWPGIEQKYYDVVSTYMKKYGRPSHHNEKFTTDVYTDNDRKKAIKDGQCVYNSIWELNEGVIGIGLISSDTLYFLKGNFVFCWYSDRQNAEKERQSKIDDI